MDDLRQDIETTILSGDYGMDDLDDFRSLLEHRRRYFCDGCESPIYDYQQLECHGFPCTLRQTICEPGEECRKSDEYWEIDRLESIVEAAEEELEEREAEEEVA